MLTISESNIHGKGVIATENIPEGTIIECDVLVFEQGGDLLKNYHYPWLPGKSSICIGFGSYFNHNTNPSVRIYKLDTEKLIKKFILLRDINKGDELTICYHPDLDNQLQQA